MGSEPNDSGWAFQPPTPAPAPGHQVGAEGTEAVPGAAAGGPFTAGPGGGDHVTEPLHPSGAWVPPAAAVPAASPGGNARRNLVLAGIAVLGLVAGAGAVNIYQSITSDASTSTAQVRSAQPGTAQNGQPVPGQPVPGQDGENGQPLAPGGGNGPGGVAGEQRIAGTLTARAASSITVKTASGTATYQVDDGTEIVRNGAQVTLAQLSVGDPVLVHLVPADGGYVAERVVAGTLPQGGPVPGGVDGGPGPDDGQPQASPAPSV